MVEANKIVRMIKQAAVEAVNAHDPTAMKVGEVKSASPLEITVGQKMTLAASQLMLTNAVRDYTVYMTVDHATGSALEEESLAHTHSYTGKKKYTAHLGLKKGEKVILLRCDGGQQFIVLDRVEVP